MSDEEAAYIDEARAHYRTRLQLQEVRRVLGNLMAVINRDGGHRANTSGSEAEAAEDCANTVRMLHVVKDAS